MASHTGEWVRTTTQFRDWVTADGSSGFAAEPGRYHLYVSYAGPWAHRTVIVRKLKGLEEAISVSAVDPIRDERGWAFRNAPGGEPDPPGRRTRVHDAALLAVPEHWHAHLPVVARRARVIGRVTDLPTLWGYLRDLLAVPGVRETVHIDDIKRHYYGTHPHVNPTLIVPIGPELDYDEPHGREALSS